MLEPDSLGLGIIQQAQKMHEISTAAVRSEAGLRHSRRIQRIAAGLAFSLLVVGATPSAADEYESGYAGHPLRFAAYVVHPIGVILETLLVRPGHWLVHRSALKGLFGHGD
jgi:hypothetical protein